MKLAGKTDVGRVRRENQDDFRAGELSGGAAWGLVCDGMGGARGGREASRGACDVVERYFQEQYGRCAPGSEEQFLAQALEKLNAAHLANQKYTSLSGGQRQLILIARAICQAAKIFVLDEPAANLDYANHQLLMEVVVELAKKGYCVVMSTHSPEHPASIGTKVLLMGQGRAAAFGSPETVITPANLQRVYGIEIDVATISDRYGKKRTICLPVKEAAASPA